MKEPKRIVREGYDQISLNYRGDEFDFEHSDYKRSLDEFEHLLCPGDRVLDLGCGCGVPMARYLAEKYRVTGVDFSPVQIARARRLVPQARFVCADMTEAEFEPSAFDAVVSFFAIIHVPIEEQFALFGRLMGWLADGGHLMATVGDRAWTGTEADWHGGEMYWSHADKDTYRTWIETLGGTILAERFLPEGSSGHTWLVARKGAS